MMEDYAVSYNASLLITKNYLKKLEKLCFNTKKIDEEVRRIEDNLEKEIAQCYEMFSKAESNIFLHESLVDVYSKATSSLDIINSQIKAEYNTYYQVNAKYKNLVNIMNNEVSKSNIAEVVGKAKELLEAMKRSSTIDYDSEKRLVEAIYELIYQILKLELISSNTDYMLEHVKMSSTDTSFISNLIRKELEKIPDDSNEIKDRLDEIEENGLDDQFILDKKLITLLALTNDENLISKVLEDFDDKLKEVGEIFTVVEEKENENIALAEKIKELKSQKKENFSKLIKKRISLTLNLLLISAGIVASGATIKTSMNTKNYKTVTTTYDSSTDETVSVEGYEKEVKKEKEIKKEVEKDFTTLTEYSPWDVPGYFRDGYKRTVYKYDLSKLDASNYHSLEDYLTPNNKKKISCEIEEEVKKEKPEDLGYTGNKYVVTKVSQDKTDYKKVPVPAWLMALTLASSTAGIILIDVLTWKKLSKTSLKLLRKNKVEIKSSLEEKRKDLLEQENEIKCLMESLKIAQDDVMRAYLALPSAVIETNSVKEKVLKLEKQNNNI